MYHTPLIATLSVITDERDAYYIIYLNFNITNNAINALLHVCGLELLTQTNRHLDAHTHQFILVQFLCQLIAININNNITDITQVITVHYWLTHLHQNPQVLLTQWEHTDHFHEEMLVHMNTKD